MSYSRYLQVKSFAINCIFLNLESLCKNSTLMAFFAPNSMQYVDWLKRLTGKTFSLCLGIVTNSPLTTTIQYIFYSTLLYSALLSAIYRYKYVHCGARHIGWGGFPQNS